MSLQQVPPRIATMSSPPPGQKMYVGGQAMAQQLQAPSVSMITSTQMPSVAAAVIRPTLNQAASLAQHPQQALTPGGGGVKRPNVLPPIGNQAPTVGPTAGQLQRERLPPQMLQQQQQQIQHQQLQAAKKRRRIGDRALPPEISELVPEYHAYMNFLDYEKKLDSLISRKRLEIQESLKRPLKLRRRLRIYVSHSFLPNRAPMSETDDGQLAQWELRVEGRLCDDEPHTAASTIGKTSHQMHKRKFSSFFKSLVIELDKEIYGPDNHLVEWHRSSTTSETDGFQVKRPGDRNVKCTILLLLDYNPMKYKLDPRLARILGIHTETRTKIIESLWEYVKKNRLQDPHEKDHINCDKYLEQTFQCQRMRFIEIPQRLNGLLMTPEPIIIHHVITCNSDGSEPKRTVVYDVDVEVDDPLKMKMSHALGSLQSQADIMACDNKIYEVIDQIQQVKLQREFFLGFAQNPKEFIEKWIVSQSKDLKLISDMVGQPEEERQSEFYRGPWVQESIGRYFYSKVQQRRSELEQALGIRP